MVSFAPSILLPNGETYTPTNYEWVFAFAIRGVPWAVEQMAKWEKAEEQARIDLIHRTATD